MVTLKTEKISRTFGSLKACDEVSLEVPEGQIRAIIGPNGAGKSTFMDLVSRRTPATSGRVFFNGEEITRCADHQIAAKGMGKCFQISKLFTQLTVFQNVQTASINKVGRIYDMFSSGKTVQKDRVMEILASIGMADKADETAGYLSYGDQRRLEIGITLAMEPTFFMLDEPTAGVSRAEGYEIMKLVCRLAKERRMTILFIEHDMDIVFNYAEQISVMSLGRLIATGNPAEIKANEFVQKVYLGGAL